MLSPTVSVASCSPSKPHVLLAGDMVPAGQGELQGSSWKPLLPVSDAHGHLPPNPTSRHPTSAPEDPGQLSAGSRPPTTRRGRARADGDSSLNHVWLKMASLCKFYKTL